MDIYVEYDGGHFQYRSSTVPRMGEDIIFDNEDKGIAQHFKTLSVTYYTNGEHVEAHIEVELKFEEKN